MDDRTAFLQAIVASPDDDLPRLVLADWLEDHDEPAYATFLRQQVELAQTPEWEPLAVHARQFARSTLLRGIPFRSQLPTLPAGLEWHPVEPFHRGLAWSLVVRNMMVFQQEAERVFSESPIGQLHLPTATLDQWRWMGRQPWLARVQSIHFYGLTLPIEPVLVLCESPHATGLTELVFEVARGLAMATLVEQIMRSPLGTQLRTLEFRGLDQGQDDLFEALLAGSSPPALTRLAFRICRFLPEHWQQLAESTVLDHLTELEFRHTTVPPEELFTLLECPRLRRLTQLTLEAASLRPFWLESLTQCPHWSHLRMLNVSGNALNSWNRLGNLAQGTSQLRCLVLNRTQFPDEMLLSVMEQWSQFTELGLAGNHLSSRAGAILCQAPAPANLVALDLRENPGVSEFAAQLQAHFGPRVITTSRPEDIM